MISVIVGAVVGASTQTSSGSTMCVFRRDSDTRPRAVTIRTSSLMRMSSRRRNNPSRCAASPTLPCRCHGSGVSGRCPTALPSVASSSPSATAAGQLQARNIDAADQLADREGFETSGRLSGDFRRTIDGNHPIHTRPSPSR